jgi:long-chain acyl-CoA synthetase
MLIKDLISSKSIIKYRGAEYVLSTIIKDKKIDFISNSRNYAIFLPNSIQYIQSYFIIASLDKIIVPIPIMAKRLEIRSIIDYCDIEIVFTNTKYKEIITNCLRDFQYKVTIYNLDDDSLDVVGENERVFPEIVNGVPSEDDVALMLHTSGTTSRPKCVMLTHKNLFSNIKSNIESLSLTERDKTLICLPLFFGYCNTAQLLTHLYLGASIVLMESMFLANTFLQIVEEERVTNFTGVPSMLLATLSYRNITKYDTSSLRYICFGGGNMPVKKLERLIELYPHSGLVQTYGQTEASPRVTALLPEDAVRKIGSVGKPIPNVQVRIVNQQQIDVPRGEVGEIIVKGENVMRGYYKRPEVTSETIKNGWLHTGDLGKFDEEGYIYLLGRIKNIIISGGINIYPEEVEELLLSHKSVEDAYVLGQPHDLLGEVPVAQVVLHKDIVDVPTDREILDYCQGQLAQYKIPVYITIVDQIEKTKTNKIKRHKENENG